MCKSHRSFGTCELASPPEGMTGGSCMSLRSSSSGRSLLPARWQTWTWTKFIRYVWRSMRHSLQIRKSNRAGCYWQAYHQQVVEEEHLSLMYTSALWSVGVRHLVKLAAANQPAVGKRQDLQNEKSATSSETNVVTVVNAFTKDHDQRKMNINALVSCLRWLSPQPGLGRHGHHWSLVPTSECAGRSLPAGHVGYPVHYLLLKDTGH